jgi:two-component system sensor histidine kinase KdpD
LKEGKIYAQSRVQQALRHFFQPDKILQLRELALKEVAGHVERKVDYEISYRQGGLRHERFLACISSNAETAKKILRKTSRLASYYNSTWYVLYVQTPREASDKIPLAGQRHLINNFKLATELGAEVIQKKSSDVAEAILQTIEEWNITTLCLGKPHVGLLKIILKTSIFNKLLQALSKGDVDLVIFS